jgi:two-component system, LytTR family, response regulator
MKVLIIEDEPLVARDIQNLILKLEPEVEVVGVLASVEEARKWFLQHIPPDLVFSDIQLSDGISFEIFESLKPNCPIIFTTAYDEYAIRAFKLNSIDYLLKPVDRDELAAALRKYRAVTVSPILPNQLGSLVQQWGKQAIGQFKERFLVVHGNSLIPLSVGDIGYFHKDTLIFVHTRKNDKYISEFQSLDELESLLDPAIFFRVNRQYIVHIDVISKVKSTHKGVSVALKEPLSCEIDISREKAGQFKKWLS